MRGASRCVWCTKVSRLIEAELFAEQIQRPAQNGRALLCAANHESNRPWHEKRRAQVQICALLSFLDARPEGVAPKEGQGVKRGQETICLVSCPLLPLSVGTDTPAAEGANVHAHFERKATVSAETQPSADGKKRSTVKAQPYRSASTLAISPRVILPSGRSVPSV